MFSAKAQTLALSVALRGVFSAGDCIADERVRRGRPEKGVDISAGRLRTCLGKGVVCTLSVHEKHKKKLW
ncbi:MAG: hypothetical protein ACFN4S_08720 [Prevotella conceptionensis]|jgi:hypothetical protein